LCSKMVQKKAEDGFERLKILKNTLGEGFERA
jgi:hypothetical protein